MPQRNEAYVEFKAKTDGFNQGIKDMNAQIKTASNELRLNATEMKGAGESAQLLADRQAILKRELEASAQKVELTEKALVECKATLGENSKEYQNLSNAVLTAKNQQAAIQNELDATTRKLSALEAENKEAASSLGQLTSKIDAEEEELAKLKKAYTENVIAEGKNSDSSKALAKQIKDLSGELADDKKKLDDAEKAADEFDKSLDDTGSSAEKTTGKLDGLSLGFAAVAAAAVKAGKAAVDAFQEVDEGADNVIRKTGATGEAAKALEQSYKNVASRVVGDFDNIGSALGEVVTRFGFTDEKAEQATEQFLKFADVTGVDAVTAVQDVARAIESAGLESDDYGAILDALTKASQATGVGVDQLAAALTDNGAVMRTMGYDTNETIAMLAQFEKAGVNSQAVTKGMQKAIANWSKDGKDAKAEFEKMVKGIQDGSVKASDAYAVFGSKAGVEMVDAIQSGRFAYDDMLTTISNSKGTLDSTFDETVDGAYELDQAMQNAKIAMGEVGSEIGTTIAPVVQTVASEILPAVSTGIQKIKDNLPAVAVLIGSITTAIVTYKVASLSAKLATEGFTIATKLQAIAQGALNTVMNMSPIGLIITAIGVLVAAFLYLWNNCEGFRNFFLDMGEKIKEAFHKVVDWFKGVFDKVPEWFENIKTTVTEKWQSFLDKVKSAFDSVIGWFRDKKEKVTSVVHKVIDFVKNNWQGLLLLIVNPFAGAFKLLWDNCESFRNFFLGLGEKIKDIWSSVVNGVKERIEHLRDNVVGVFLKIKSAVETPIIAARDTIKGVIDKIKGFFDDLKLKLPPIKLPHFKIEGTFSLDPPSVPHLAIEWYAKGALFRAPTIVQAGDRVNGFGEAGPEYALPLNERSLTPLATMLSTLQMNGNNGLISMITRRFEAAIERLADRLQRIEAVSYIDGERISTMMAPYSDAVDGVRTELADRGLAV